MFMEALRTHLERGKVDKFLVLKHVRRFGGLSFTLYKKRNPIREEARLVKRIKHVDLPGDPSGAEDYPADNDDRYVNEEVDRYVNEKVYYAVEEENENETSHRDKEIQEDIIVETMKRDIFQNVHI